MQQLRCDLGDARCRHGLVLKCLPVKIFKPGMSLDIQGTPFQGSQSL